MLNLIYLAEFLIFVIVIGAAAVIAIVTYIIFRILRPKLKDGNEKPSEEEIRNEEMNRLLKPIEDEDTAKAVEDYKEDEE